VQQHVRTGRTGSDQVLAVIQHQQHPLPAQMVAQLIEQRSFRFIAQAQR